MPITSEDIKQHQEFYDIGDIVVTPTSEYREIVKKEAYFRVDHHDFLKHTLSDETLATNVEQIDVLIEQLKELRQKMTKPLEWLSEK